jgi:hypothetical protein
MIRRFSCETVAQSKIRRDEERAAIYRGIDERALAGSGAVQLPSAALPNDDLADAVAMLAADVQSERDRDERQPGRERSAKEWKQLRESVGYLHREIHRAVVLGDVSLEPVQRWASTQRLFERQPFRALRNVPEAQALRDHRAVKPRTMVELWLWWHLPEPPEPGKHFDTRRIQRDLVRKLNVEDWSKTPWCLTTAEAAKFQARVAKHLKVTQRGFRMRLTAIGWLASKNKPPNSRKKERISSSGGTGSQPHVSLLSPTSRSSRGKQMARPQNDPVEFPFPPTPDPTLLPHNGDRPYFAKMHRWYWGPISTAQLRAWPIRWIYLNGRAVGSVRDFIAEAEKRYAAAPVLNEGRLAPPT